MKRFKQAYNQSIELQVIIKIGIPIFLILGMVFLDKAGSQYILNEDKKNVIKYESQEFSVKLKGLYFDLPNRKLLVEGTNLKSECDTCFVLLYAHAFDKPQIFSEGDTLVKKSDELCYKILSEKFITTQCVSKTVVGNDDIQRGTVTVSSMKREGLNDTDYQNGIPLQKSFGSIEPGNCKHISRAVGS